MTAKTSSDCCEYQRAANDDYLRQEGYVLVGGETPPYWVKEDWWGWQS